MVAGGENVHGPVDEFVRDDDASFIELVDGHGRWFQDSYRPGIRPRGEFDRYLESSIRQVFVPRPAYPWLPVGLLMKDQYRSRDHIAAVRAPLLILHGAKDRVIPQGFGKRLFDAASEPKTFLSLGPVGHAALFLSLIHISDPTRPH